MSASSEQFNKTTDSKRSSVKNSKIIGQKMSQQNGNKRLKKASTGEAPPLVPKQKSVLTQMVAATKAPSPKHRRKLFDVTKAANNAK